MGISVKFGITAIGTPAISYKWIKNGTDSVGNMDTLTFASIQASDSGSYKCVVTNVAGADTIRNGYPGFIAGATAPPGRRMGHAGAIVSGGKGTAAAKIAAFRKAGIGIAATPSEMADTLLRMM